MCIFLTEMDTGVKRSSVSEAQLNTLLEFMKEHPDLAKGLYRGSGGKITTFRLWKACANKLNALKPGTVKDGKGWSKYWCDWKYRVRRHALELKFAKIQPTDAPPLTAVEEIILGIIGEESLEGVVIKSDPLDDDVTNNQNGCSSSSYGTRSNRRKRNQSIQEINHVEDDPSSPPEIKRRWTSNEESDEEDEAAQFLMLERLKLESSLKLHESVQNMSSQISMLTDVMREIRDVLVSRNNV